MGAAKTPTTTIDFLLQFAASVHRGRPANVGKLQDSTDPRVLWNRLRAAVTQKYGDSLRVMVEYLSEHPDSEFLTGARLYFLNEKAERWYSVEVELVVNVEEKATPAAHWVRNLLQLKPAGA